MLVQRGLTLQALANLGVARVSTGSLQYRSALSAATHAAEAVRSTIDLQDSSFGTLTYTAAQTTVADYAR